MEQIQEMKEYAEARAERVCNGEFPITYTREQVIKHTVDDFIAGADWMDDKSVGNYRQAIFDTYHAIKAMIGKLGYITFIHSKEVDEYREWLRNDRYKHRLEWFEKKYPNGLYYKDDDGTEYGVNIMTKQFLAEADVAYDNQQPK